MAIRNTMSGKLNILLVEDDIDDQEIFSMTMEEIYPSCECIFANDGRDAIELIKVHPKYKPDYIFIDINMPRMNGIECLIELRKFPQLSKVPMYMYSTSAETKIVNQCFDLGAIDFIVKHPENEMRKKVFSKIFSIDQ
jgi:CheY-like chemotaxis protein